MQKATTVEVAQLGGRARAAKLSPRRRKAIAKKAATVRWAKYRETQNSALGQKTV